MVRINLLPVRLGKKRERGKQTLVLYGVLLAGALIGNFTWYSSRNSKSEGLLKAVKSTQAEIQQLDKVIGEVQNITRDKKALEDKLKVLDTLKRARSGPVRLLDAVASVLPKKVWLKGMVENQGAMNFEGIALSHEDLAEFMRALENAVWTPKGLGRVVEGRPGAKRSRVEVLATGTVEEFSVDKVSFFFTDLNLKQATQTEDSTNKTKLVEFTIICKANYAT